MPLKGVARVKRNYRALVERIEKDYTERAVYQILSSGGAMAANMTPIDTSNLINSQYAPQIVTTKDGTRGQIGYTAKYAKWVHDAPGKLKGQPRAHFGKTRAGQSFGGGTQTGTYWSPNAEPQFLVKGFDGIAGSIPAILKKAYRV